SGKNCVRKFLRALYPKWRAKAMTIEESKELTSLSLDELTGNLKVLELIIKKDSEIVKAKGERKSLALMAKKESSDEESMTFRTEDEEYAMAVRDFKRRGRTENSSIDKFTLDNEYDKLCKKETSPGGSPLITEGGPYKAQTMPISIKRPPVCSSDAEKSDSFQKSVLGARPKHIMICLRVDLEPDEWIKDSGCSKHMTGNQKLFLTYKAYTEGNNPKDKNFLATIDENSMLWHRILGHANMRLI
nr:transposase, Ptta/En/Spm, transposase, Tnp1/En/Spm-like protein [Tanacetum cinerariifolium]